MDRLANFLGVDIDETLRDDVIAQSSFEKMVKKNDTYKDELGIDELKDGFNFFRKGARSDIFCRMKSVKRVYSVIFAIFLKWRVSRSA